MSHGIDDLRERMNDYRLRSRSPYKPIAEAYADAADQIEERLIREPRMSASGKKRDTAEVSGHR